MDNLLPTRVSSVSRLKQNRISAKLHPSMNYSSNGFFILITASILFLLLTFTVTPAVAQRPRSSTNPHLKHLASCSSDSDCDFSSTFLRCHQKTCQCTTITYFDEDRNRCLIRVGGSCTPKDFKQFCVAYANCETKGYSTQGTCKCKPKYKENIESLCVSGQSSYYVPSSVSLIVGIPLALLLLQSKAL